MVKLSKELEKKVHYLKAMCFFLNKAEKPLSGSNFFVFRTLFNGSAIIQVD